MGTPPGAGLLRSPEYDESGMKWWRRPIVAVGRSPQRVCGQIWLVQP